MYEQIDSHPEDGTNMYISVYHQSLCAFGTEHATYKESQGPIPGLGYSDPYINYLGMCHRKGVWFSGSKVWDRI